MGQAPFLLPRSPATSALTANQQQATRITVAPLAVAIHSCAERTRPIKAELSPTSKAHQNMPPRACQIPGRGLRHYQQCHDKQNAHEP